jgi:acetyl-CoA C-acetyltransferase
MRSQRSAVVVSAVRTAIGAFGGSLKDQPPTALAATVLAEAVRRATIAPGTVDHVVFGNVIHTDAHDPYLARVAAVQGGLPVTTPAVTVNRLCGSGLQAIVTAAQQIELGLATVTVAGGAECMSRAPYWLPSLRWGQRMQDALAVDALIAALSDPFNDCHMGLTAEHVARQWSISRPDQDALALESHQRAARAIQAGYFAEQIVPIDVTNRRSVTQFAIDEHVRLDTSLAKLAALRPAFDPAGTVTAGNAAGVNDGAAALVLMDGDAAQQQDLTPLGRLVSYGFAGIEPMAMGMGPVPAIRSALNRAGITVDALDVIELNEAFAAQALAVMRELQLPADRTNPNGSGIALGHPIGATGAILTVKALHELRRIDGRYALVTMCIGGGQGIAAVFSRD